MPNTNIAFWLSIGGCLIIALAFILVPAFLIKEKRFKLLSSGLALGLTLLSLVIYNHFGAIKAVKDRALIEKIAGVLINLHQQNDFSHANILDTLKSLEGEIKYSDVGWGYIAGIYQHLGFFEEAQKAYHQAFLLANDVHQYGLQEAYMVSKLNNGNLSNPTREYLHHILSIEPYNQDALNLLAIDAYQHQNYKAAINNWRKILQHTNELMEDDKQAIKSMIASSLLKTNQNTLENKAQNDISPLTSITVSVNISENLKKSIDPQKNIYIFAKSLIGPPMPLAVQKIKAHQLPLTITLDSTMAMMPELSLDSATDIIIGARISQNGEPTFSPGDIEIFSAPLNLELQKQHEITLLFSETS